MAVSNPALCEMVWVLLRGHRYTPAQVAHTLRRLLQVCQVSCLRHNQFMARVMQGRMLPLHQMP